MGTCHISLDRFPMTDINPPIEPRGDNSCTTSDQYVKILDLREGNEESPEETTGCKASVYAEFDDCPRVGKFVKLFDFRHFERFFRFDQSDRKT